MDTLNGSLGGTVPNRVIIPDMTQMPRPAPGTERYVFGGDIFATTWQITLYAGAGFDTDELHRQCEARLAQIDAEMSPYRADSDLMRFNRAATDEFVVLPERIMQVVRYALAVAQLSGGAFDPTLLSAVNLWGFGPQPVAESLPPVAAIAALRAGGWRELMPLREGMVQPGGVQLDLNAIAKGFAVDELSALCGAAGADAALVEIGGELKGFGVRPDGLPWWAEIEAAHPRTVIALCDWAVATSGDARRAFVHEGRTYSHTIDAMTQSPVDTDILSATVLDAECWRADALATALIVMGNARAIAFADRHDIACLLRVCDGATVRDVLSSRLTGWV